jgi:hypothetical protein
MQPTGKRPLSDLKNAAPGDLAAKSQRDSALGAVMAADPAEARTTQDAYDKKGGWKPVDVDGTPSEYQIRPAKGDPASTVVTVRQKTNPKKILASQYIGG